jgi:two-component system nitrate/nitrite response regulator NarL
MSLTVNNVDPVITVIVADSSRMDCQLLADAIQRHNNFRVVARASSCSEVISAVSQIKPDVAVISARLQEGVLSGLRVLRDLRALHPRPSVIMLVDDESPELVVEVFRNGARGIFTRSGVSAKLRKCIQAVRNGQIWINNNQLEHILTALTQAPVPRLATAEVAKVLTKREEEVARLVAAGLSNHDVSQRLGLSQHTVKNYLFHVFEKLEISTRVELLLYLLSQSKPAESVNNSNSSDQPSKLRA